MWPHQRPGNLPRNPRLHLGLWRHAHVVGFLGFASGCVEIPKSPMRTHCPQYWYQVPCSAPLVKQTIARIWKAFCHHTRHPATPYNRGYITCSVEHHFCYWVDLHTNPQKKSSRRKWPNSTDPQSQYHFLTTRTTVWPNRWYLGILKLKTNEQKVYLTAKYSHYHKMEPIYTCMEHCMEHCEKYWYLFGMSMGIHPYRWGPNVSCGGTCTYFRLLFMM